MEWRDDGIVISVRRHGETSAIAELLTEHHGRFLGLVRGGRSRTMRPVLQAGNAVQATWRARLEDHLGIFQIEPLQLRAGSLIDDPFKLSGLAALAALAQLLPEREPHRRIYDALNVVLAAMDDDGVWPALVVRFELGLLDELGFGLNLASCAATGATSNLTHVSPRSGRAVSAAAAEPYRPKLLPLPEFLLGKGGAATPSDVLEGMRLTGHFLARHVFDPRGIDEPEARRSLIARMAQRQH
jgi:DNA repair protein RecO (recombination protein O)